MDILKWIVIIYIAVINIIGFVICGTDKKRARNGEWRIAEKTFFITAILGGAAGVYLGMYYFRHKTKHWYFVIGIPVIFIMEIVLTIILLKNLAGF